MVVALRRCSVVVAVFAVVAIIIMTGHFAMSLSLSDSQSVG